MKDDAITIQATINAPIEKVWQYWNEPQHIMKWAFADDTWEAPEAENDLRAGGKFRTKMAAKDKSASFDFTGIYTLVNDNQQIEYTMDGADNRKVSTKFEDLGGQTKVTQTFDIERENTPEKQRAGWQGILDNFKKYAENN